MDRFKGLFQGKFTFTWKIYKTVIFITFTLRLIFRIDVFPNFYYWLLAKLAYMTIGPFSKSQKIHAIEKLIKSINKY